MALGVDVPDSERFDPVRDGEPRPNSREFHLGGGDVNVSASYDLHSQNYRLTANQTLPVTGVANWFVRNRRVGLTARLNHTQETNDGYPLAVSAVKVTESTSLRGWLRVFDTKEIHTSPNAAAVVALSGLRDAAVNSLTKTRARRLASRSGQ